MNAQNLSWTTRLAVRKSVVIYHAFLGVFTSATLFYSEKWFYTFINEQGTSIGLDPSHPYFKFLREQKVILDEVFLKVSIFLFVAFLIFGLAIALFSKTQTTETKL